MAASNKIHIRYHKWPDVGKELKDIHIRRAKVIFIAILIFMLILCFIYVYYLDITISARQSSMSVEKHRLFHNGTKKFISATFKGRLGNHLFAYCSLIGTAKKNGMIPIVPEDALLWDVFDIPEEMGGVDDLRYYTPYHATKAAFYYPNFQHLSDTDSYLVGYLQSWKYCDFMKDSLLHNHLKFKNSVTREAERYIDKVLIEKGKQGAVTIGVHVRRGDFARQRRKGFTAAPVPYIYKAQNYFRKKYKDVVFIVCSNDILWCEDNLDNYPDIHYSHNSDGNLDLAILASTNHTIITSGSFSWWAGYFNRGDVIYYNGYPEPNTEIGNATNRADYYPPYWIPMDVG